MLTAAEVFPPGSMQLNDKLPKDALRTFVDEAVKRKILVQEAERRVKTEMKHDLEAPGKRETQQKRERYASGESVQTVNLDPDVPRPELLLPSAIYINREMRGGSGPEG